MHGMHSWVPADEASLMGTVSTSPKHSVCKGAKVACGESVLTQSSSRRPYSVMSVLTQSSSRRSYSIMSVGDDVGHRMEQKWWILNNRDRRREEGVSVC